MITTYLVSPIYGFDLEDYKKSLSSLNGKVVVLEGVDFSHLHECETPYYMVLFPGEFLSEQLIEVMHLYTAHDFDIVLMYRRVVGTDKTQIVPRLFKSTVILGKDNLIPEATKELNITKALDGWLFARE